MVGIASSLQHHNSFLLQFLYLTYFLFIQFFHAISYCFRHSFEYLDREDVIVAHMVGGVDAFVKLPQGWPLSEFGLELKSLKSTSQYSEEISLSVVCKTVVSGVTASFFLSKRR